MRTVALWLVLLSTPACAEDYWGRQLADLPANFIFGYGSLMNSASRNATANAPVPAIAARLSARFGFVRCWNARSNSGFTALGLCKPDAGEAALTINGVLLPVESTDLAAFDARETGYVRVEAPRDDLEAVSWQGLPRTGKIWIYVPKKDGQAPGVGLPPDAGFPILESYVDVVVEGALEYGEDFARELIATTKGWNEYWLNDRELARRPWAADRNSAAVDALLGELAPHFADRRFAEEYAAKFYGGK